MIEVNEINNEINLDEIMRKIKEEVILKRHELKQNEQQDCINQIDPINKDIAINILSINTDQITNHVNNADQFAEVGTKNLPMLEFNILIRWIARIVGQIVLYLGLVITVPQRFFNHYIINALREIIIGFWNLNKTLSVLQSELNKKDSLIEKLEYRIYNLETQAKTQENQAFDILNLKETLDNLKNNLETQAKTQENQAFDILNLKNNLETQVKTQENQAFDILNLKNNLETQAKTQENQALDILNLKNNLETQENKVITSKRDIYDLKIELSVQKNRIGLFLEEARKRLPEKLDNLQLEFYAQEEAHLLSDSLYVSFEDRFRGSEEDIKNRLKVYVPIMKEAKAGDKDRLILDLGCGRGEWLELSREENFYSMGIDINKILIERALRKGFNVKEQNAVKYLKSLPDNSLGAVVSFHLIEHLKYQDILTIFKETIRVLKSGGIAVFETPNPENLIVGACSFYSDLSHRKPLVPIVMQFLLEYFGLCKVEIKRLHPYPEELRVQQSLNSKLETNLEIIEKFNDFFYGPQDYAIIGYKI